jgi:hypothetical protein
MNDALSMGLKLVRRWRQKYACDVDLIIEPHVS